MKMKTLFVTTDPDLILVRIGNPTKVCQVPLLSFFHNQVSKKLEVIGDGDSSSDSLISLVSELLNKVDSVLSHSVTSGQNLV